MIRQHTTQLTTVDEIGRMCRSAVGQAFKGDRYGTDAIEEATAELLIGVWESMPKYLYAAPDRPAATSLAGDRVIYSKHSQAKSLDKLGLEVGRAAFPTALVPSYGVLRGRAMNLRKSYDRKLAHLHAEGSDCFEAGTVQADEGNRAPDVTMAQAHKMALAMLDDIGIRPLRKGDLPVFTLAYTAARYATLYALDIANIGEQVADELGQGYDAYKKNCQRAAKRLPAVGRYARPAWADALALPDGGIAQKPSRSRTMSADLNDTGERASQPCDYPLTTTTGEPTPWYPPMAVVAPWARNLPRATQARLRTASTLSHGKAAREALMRQERARTRQEVADAHTAHKEAQNARQHLARTLHRRRRTRRALDAISATLG